MTEPIYAYDESENDFRLFTTEQEWAEHISVQGAISYLKKHLQKSLTDDFYPAYEACYQKSVGFFALPRIVFPYITFLGTLFDGKDSSKNAVNYMHIYLSKVNQIYADKELCDFIYLIHRHGLTHTNMPKVASENGKVFGWQISFDDTKHLRVYEGSHLGKAAILSISPKKLADEVISSINEYISDLQSKPELFDKFKEGFISMATTSHYIDRGRSKRLVIPNYLRSTLSNNYFHNPTRSL